MNRREFKRILLEVGAIVMCLIVLFAGTVIGLAVMDVSSVNQAAAISSEPLVQASVLAGAQTFGGLVPCGNEPDANTAANSCGLPQFITLIRNVINALFIISVFLATIAFTYVGWMLLTAQGDVGKRNDAKYVAKSVVFGFLIILSAWLLVYTITTALLDPCFNSFLSQKSCTNT